MELSAEEIKNCENFNKTKKYQVDKTERIKKIIEMAKAGISHTEIKSVIPGDTCIVGETLMKARRRGII